MSNRPKFKQQQKTRQRRQESSTPAGGSASAKSWWQSPFVWVGGLVIVALAVAVGLSVAGGDDESAPGTAAETAFAEIIGNPLPPLEGADQSIGTTAPVVVGQNFEGERLRLGDDGVARVYGFFAHWCPHCQRELPRTVDWLATNDLPDGVEVVAISTAVDDNADNYPPSAWFEREGWNETVVVDSETRALANGFGLSGFPFWVAVDADDTVVARTSGELTIPQFEALIDAVTPAGGDEADDSSAAEAGLRLVSVDQAASIHADRDDELIVLDVRTPEEFAEGHLEDAQMLDFYADDFADRLAELPRDQPYLLYCRSGNRSGQTIAMMADLGFADVSDVDGGILAWQQAGYQLVP